MGPLTVEVIEHRTQMRRFVDIPYLLFRDEPRWTRGVRAYEQWRLDERRHPFFDRGYAAYFLARRGGRPVGRITAHVDERGATEGSFGFLAAPDDAAVVAGLVDAARRWLDGEGATAVEGPRSWTEAEASGVPVAGVDAPGVTGRAWQPGYYAEHLTAAGCEATTTTSTYRLDTAAEASSDTKSPAGASRDVPAEELPPQAGHFADPDLVLDDIAAVPDVSGLLAGASLRSAWRLARRARDRHFETAVCVRCDGDAADAVPRLAAAAAAAGYRELVAPWGPAGAEPETTHRQFRLDWS